MNVRVVFLTQPSPFDDTEHWRRMTCHFACVIHGIPRPISCATVWRLLDVYNRELIQTCQEENVECFDLASVMPHSTRYFYDCMHFNEHGVSLVARQVAAYLERRGLRYGSRDLSAGPN